MGISEAATAVNKLEKYIRDLQLYSGDEIFENLPDSDKTKDEIIDLIENSMDIIEELKEFFE